MHGAIDAACAASSLANKKSVDLIDPSDITGPAMEPRAA